MKQFFKFMFASMLGTFLTLLVFFFLFIGIIASIAALSKESPTVVEANSILHLKLDQPIYDRSPNMPFEDFDFATFKSTKALGLTDLLKQINDAATDKNITGIYLELSSIQASLATISEIREAILKFKDSGKFVIAYSEIMTQGAYFLASAADNVYMNPEGFLDFKGMSASVMYFKGLIDKLDIDMQIIRGSNNKFKSAVEPFMLDKMSDANREQLNKLLSSMWSDVLVKISASRNIDIATLNSIADSLLVFSVNNGVKVGLVDATLYYDQMLDTLKVKSGIDADKKLKFLSAGQYSKAPKNTADLKIKDKIAVVYAYGDIIDGEGDDKSVGSIRTAKALREARLDKNVKAVVFRVNSPGGSALASEVILREAELTAAAKPFIVSMGDLAASGGYYISCKAHKIIASPGTITGSIGVFGVIPNLEKMLKNKAGINIETVKTNAHSDYMTAFRAMDNYEFIRLQSEIDRIYNTFKKHVADGRGMTVEQVDSIGQGRVWSGTDALALGLIDELGGFERAVEIAASEANLEKYRIVEYPERKDPFQQLIDGLTGKEETEARIKTLLGKYFFIYENAEIVKRFSGIQARLPYDITIQ
jgi:protease IV